MIFSSLPDYRRFSDAALERLRDGRSTVDRIAGMLFNLAILAGLWGAPLYARCMILSDVQAPKDFSESLRGTWRTTDGSHFVITFTEQGEFRVSWKGRLIDSSRFWFDERSANVVLLGLLGEQIRDHKGVFVNCGFWGTVKGDRLFVKRSYDELSQARPGYVWEVEGERLELAPYKGQMFVREHVK